MGWRLADVPCMPIRIEGDCLVRCEWLLLEQVYGSPDLPDARVVTRVPGWRRARSQSRGSGGAASYDVMPLWRPLAQPPPGLPSRRRRAPPLSTGGVEMVKVIHSLWTPLVRTF
ncbi:hypothetical protein FB559_2466 [Actinoallomurus bryophytorum]|uniref:Uncharacterized protein n=1 Tax=Actinoallomurus bryophytorum TaxID=1490222 RepID=A0A543CII5_9ACTN|nr:hypothetical protein FB559_2466 [Actinoallomurus bryophytorum]